MKKYKVIIAILGVSVFATATYINTIHVTNLNASAEKQTLDTAIEEGTAIAKFLAQNSINVVAKDIGSEVFESGLNMAIDSLDNTEGK